MMNIFSERKIGFCICVLMLCLALHACIRKRDIVILEAKSAPQLAVTALLSPQEDTIKVYLSKTILLKKTLPRENPAVDDATVQIKDLNTQKSIILNARGNGLYDAPSKAFEIVPGHRYLVAVIHAHFGNVYGQTTVPLLKAIWETAELSVCKMHNNRFLGRWKSVDNSANNRYAVSIYTQKFNYTPMLKEDIQYAEGYFSVLRTPLTVYAGSNSEVLYINLLTLDTEMNKYIEQTDVSFYVNDYAKENFADILGIFKGIIPTYSNVKNGVGIVGSYQKEQIKTYFAESP